MAQLALGVVGAAVGGAFFGPVGASIGWSIGAAVGSTFEPNKHVYGPRIDDLHLSGSSYGSFITRGWGTFRTGCNIIDQTDLVETEHTSGGGKGGGGGTETHTYTYSASVDAAICEGPILSVRKIWANGRLIYDTTQGSTVDNSGVPVTFYLGDEDQEADATFEAERGAGEVPPYRGVAHAVFANWELGPFGNALPQMNFEVANETRLPGITEVHYRNDLPMTWGGYTAGALYASRRYSPRILSWPLTGTIEIEQIGARGGTTTLDAETLDVISAHLAVAEDPATADFDSGGAPQYRYFYCGTTAEGTEIWHNAAQGGNLYIHDRSLYTGVDELSFPAISSSRPTWEDVDPGGGVDDRALGSVDLGYTWGIPVGEVPRSVCLSANGRMVFVTTISEPALSSGSGLASVGGGTADKWYSIVDGEIAAQGTIAAGADLQFAGNFSHRPNMATAASFENNRRYMWYVFGGDGLVKVYHIGDDGVFDEHEPTAAATHELWSSESEWYPLGGAPYYHDTPEQSRYGVPENADDAAPTAESPAVWEIGGTPWVSILASSSEGYAGVARATTVATLKRFESQENYTTLDVIVGDLCRIAGLEAGLDDYQYDVTDLEGVIVRGFVLTQQMSARAAIEALMPIYFFDAVESDGAIKFVRRGGASVATIPDDDLAAHTDGEAIPALLSCTRTQEQDLPATMSLTYINPDADYQVGSAVSRRMIGGSLEVVTVQAPVVLDPVEAKARVDALLYAAWYERESYAWTTTRAYVHLEPTDVVTVGGDAKVLRITRKTEGADGVVRFEGVPSFGPVFSQPGGGGDGGSGFPAQEPPTTQDTDLALLDIPLVDPVAGPAAPVYYAAMAGADRRSWLGASLQRSNPAASSYTEVLADRVPETIGEAAGALGDFSGGNIFDEVNSVSVVLNAGAGTLESLAQSEVLAGGNEALIGDEIIRFRTATLTATRTYTLSGLLRGRRGTEWAMSTHRAGDRFVLLPEDWRGLSADAMGIGATRLFKPVTFGNTVAGTTAVPFQYNGVVLLPYAPVYPVQGQNGDGDWLLSWTRRTRYGGEWRDYVDVPLSEASEAYTVTIYDDDTYGTVKRTISATTASATYTAAQQTSDFGSPQSEIYWAVAQIGAIGPGYDSLGRAPAPLAEYSTAQIVAIGASLGFSATKVMDAPIPSSGVDEYETSAGDGMRSGASGLAADEALVIVFKALAADDLYVMTAVGEFQNPSRVWSLSTSPCDWSAGAMYVDTTPSLNLTLASVTPNSAAHTLQAGRTYYVNVKAADPTSAADHNLSVSPANTA